jgi:RNA processing factor Prp31
MDISPIDLINIESFANRVIHLFEYRKSLQEVKIDFFSFVIIYQ